MLTCALTLVFVEVALLGKFAATLLDGADIGLLLCVDAEMIKHVVPFFKNSPALEEVTDERLRPPTGFRVVIFDVEELIGVWQLELLL